ncbi:3-hydroxyisobutyrate dehydrogenase [Amycolatopsis mediterranei S699]|uniref:3-hydroxyisobutyrate dehydrogenase n=2 Tax=Amycolatopsis mediterranei TaxID=33910 RepID=A0A0H3D1I5_AMYMU|nr:NAD(P)-dependent oxidoreductase [Amycolatopsis mediterranei]ADJ44505.1 3-hydroxyisobutyrate dehydrogenase [Amycolatopsis mediterranei U32]AFO76218.1 3-hydroxyisobutyrate dehydrogenase [Amycolatopsis mediterranei S699]AGT83347.1 3-hydroxyisobutyrate dehydrogenase [Amycolatopsis mediterranei RB]KDO07137.1 3-hydroxyisobutyrate dehydrogenase [Amycolatopsis mediterranei]KDU92514.1 3-hydroxyisobutyrate dehydrogenase [Amycolatopsis mediterranei]
MTVAFLGTGIMGAPMAANIAKAGLDVRVWNRTREKAEPLSDVAAVADSAASAADGADTLVTMLADGPAVAEAFEAASPASGTLWLQMSTVGLDWTDRLAALAEQAGVVFVDAPVLGTRQPAEQAQLQVLASGPEEARPKATPVFDAVAIKTQWLGPAGNGSRLKLVLNAWVLALTNGTAESLGLARALGLDPALFLETIEGGGLDVGYAHVKGGAMLSGEYPPAFPAALAAKDARLVVEAAAEDVDVAGAKAALAHLEAAVEAGHGDEDMAALYRAVVKER